MMIRIIGAVFVLLGCGSFGFLLSKSMKTEIQSLQNFLLAIEYMESELKYRMTPLPTLCLGASSITRGVVSKIFDSLGKSLSLQNAPNVSKCMTSVLENYSYISPKLTSLFNDLGKRLGIFDLDGQVCALSSIHDDGKNILRICSQGHTGRSRSYKTIAVCAGAAIVILLI